MCQDICVKSRLLLMTDAERRMLQGCEQGNAQLTRAAIYQGSITTNNDAGILAIAFEAAARKGYTHCLRQLRGTDDPFSTEQWIRFLSVACKHQNINTALYIIECCQAFDRDPVVNYCSCVILHELCVGIKQLHLFAIYLTPRVDTKQTNDFLFGMVYITGSPEPCINTAFTPPDISDASAKAHVCLATKYESNDFCCNTTSYHL
jgi:hypothetical protein